MALTPDQRKTRGTAMRKIHAAALLLAGLFASASAQAQAPAQDFYRGKTISFIIGYGPGGGVDTASRLIIRHLFRFIPGKPDITPQNMEGAGGVISGNYLGARALQQRLRADAAIQLKGFDAILTIPATGEAPEGLDFTGDPVFCALWSFLGLPALTVPIARSVKGLPLGLQLIAPYKQDAHLLRTGRWVELSMPTV
jgi:hypothetical protein